MPTAKVMHCYTCCEQVSHSYGVPHIAQAQLCFTVWCAVSKCTAAVSHTLLPVQLNSDTVYSHCVHGTAQYTCNILCCDRALSLWGPTALHTPATAPRTMRPAAATARSAVPRAPSSAPSPPSWQMPPAMV